MIRGEGAYASSPLPRNHEILRRGPLRSRAPSHGAGGAEAARTRDGEDGGIEVEADEPQTAVLRGRPVETRTAIEDRRERWTLPPVVPDGQQLLDARQAPVAMSPEARSNVQLGHRDQGIAAGHRVEGVLR